MIRAWVPDLSERRKKEFMKYLDMIFNEETSLTNGKLCRKLEKKLAEMHGKRYAVVCANASVGYECLLQYYREVYGKNVCYVQSLGFNTCWLVPKRLGMKVIACDITENPILIDCNNEFKDGVVVPVWLFGWFSREREKEILDALEDCVVVNDVAHCLGSCRRMISDGVISFSATKIVTGGEGGVILTDDKEVYEWCREAINIGRPDGCRKSRVIGQNWKMSELTAAFILSGLSRLNEIVKRLTRLHNEYKERLADVKGIKVYEPEGKWQYNGYLTVAISERIPRHVFEVELKESYNVEMWVGYCRYSIGEEGVNVCDGGSYKTASRIASRLLVLPKHIYMFSSEVEYVCNCITKIVEGWKW